MTLRRSGTEAAYRASGHPVVRSHAYIEETGKTMSVSLVRPAEETIRFRMMPGDPLEVRLRDYRLSLRRSEAARVAITPLP